VCVCVFVVYCLFNRVSVSELSVRERGSA